MKRTRVLLAIAAVLSVLCMVPGSRADIQNPIGESPIEGAATGSPVSELQAFRGHVSSTMGATMTVRLLIPTLSVSLQLPCGTSCADVAASGLDRSSGLGDVLNVSNLPPEPVTMECVGHREWRGVGPTERRCQIE